MMTGNEEETLLSRNTALSCLDAIGNHYGHSMEPDRLIHDYALDDASLNSSKIVSIARGNGFKANAQKLSISKLHQLEGVFPLIAPLNNGNYVVLAGIKKENDQIAFVVFDPLANVDGLIGVPESDFLENWSGEVIFFKRPYSIKDPNQPFGLTWFLPEIIKHKSVFRDVAVAALTLHFLGLATPIFFQLVIDKVLVHQSFSTLYVLAIGITVALVFEAGFRYLRQYLLLEATNKIDISLVTKTFSHLRCLFSILNGAPLV